MLADSCTHKQKHRVIVTISFLLDLVHRLQNFKTLKHDVSGIVTVRGLVMGTELSGHSVEKIISYKLLVIQIEM